MKLIDILKEDPYQDLPTEIDEYGNELTSIINSLLPYKKQIQEALNSTPIYRGMKNTSDIILGNGNELNRSSANTRNYYTLLMSADILDSWDGWPKRSKSFICTNNWSKAKNYGSSVYRIIPLENQDIAICSADDFWDSFPGIRDYYVNDLSELNTSLNVLYYKMYYHVYGERDDLDQSDIDVFKSQIEFMDNFINERDSETLVELAENEFTSVEEIFTTMINDGGVIQSLNKRLSPKANGNKLVNSISQIPPGNNEIWLSGNVLFVSNAIMLNNEFKEAMQ